MGKGMGRDWKVIDVTIPASGTYSDEVLIPDWAWAILYLTGTHDASAVVFQSIGKSGDTYGPALEAGAQATRAVVNDACSVEVPASALGYGIKIASNATSAITARLVTKD